jgi:competence ComEA-like helix-hairpin-helix protein
MMRGFAIGIFGLALASFLWSATAQDDLPDGAGKDALLKMCVNCHGVDRVTGSQYSKKMWIGVVDDMVNRGAEGSDEEINALIGYLTRNFGKPVNVNTATAKEISDDLSFSSADAELVVKYRTDHGAFKTYEDLLKVPGLDRKLLEEEKKNIQF